MCYDNSTGRRLVAAQLALRPWLALLPWSSKTRVCEQVDALSTELAQVRKEADELPLLRRSLDKATKEAADADAKLAAAVTENQQIQEQVRHQSAETSV